MALRRTCRSSFSTASFAALMDARYAGIATAARIATISMTIISSSRVNPASGPLPAVLARAIFKFSVRPRNLPVGILGPVQGRTLRFGIDIVDVLSTEGVAGRVVLLGTQTPLRLAGHRVDGNTAQEAHLLALDFHALDQCVQIRGIVVAVHLCLDAALVGSVLVGVD